MSLFVMVWLAAQPAHAARAGCQSRLSSPILVSDLLDPTRDAESVRGELLLRGALAPASPLDRTLVSHVLKRCCVHGLDPEVAWHVDGRWILYRDPPRPPRLFTSDLAHEVCAPALAAELNSRLAVPQVTRVSDLEVVTDVPVHRLNSDCRALRRVFIDDRHHLTASVTRLGYDEAPEAVRQLFAQIGVIDELRDARRRLTVPRYARWPSRLRRVRPEYGELRFVELRLSGGPKPLPGDVNVRDLHDAYVQALANGQVPLILDRWELDESLRHAAAALILPPGVHRWFQATAARLLELASRGDADQTRVALWTRLMRQFAGALDLSLLVLEGEVERAEEFVRRAEFVWPTLGVFDRVTPARFLNRSPAELARALNRGVMAGDEPPDVDVARTLTHLHHAMIVRRAQLSEAVARGR